MVTARPGGSAGQRGGLVGLFFLRAEHDDHALSFENRHLIYLAIFLKIVGETEQKHLALFFEEDGTALEEHIGLDLRAFLQEADGMFELEVIVMVVGLRTESYFLDNHLGRFSLDFFGFLLLLIEEFLVVDHTAYRGFGRG